MHIVIDLVPQSLPLDNTAQYCDMITYPSFRPYKFVFLADYQVFREVLELFIKV